jgi:hypothetical protein
VIIYEVYKDSSDEYNQDYDSFGYFSNEARAIRELKAVLKRVRKLTDEELEYIDPYNYGDYGVQKIKVNTEE